MITINWDPVPHLSAGPAGRHAGKDPDQQKRGDAAWLQPAVCAARAVGRSPSRRRMAKAPVFRLGEALLLFLFLLLPMT